jgi:methylenetetrahydrofolate reductase (NADPH)
MGGHLYVKEAFLGESKERRKQWGEAPLHEKEIFQVFADYIDGKVKFLPWCESALHLETGVIKDKLRKLNEEGFLTINSQPRVNAAPSSEPPFGWGPPNGFVYQKAYIEFFTSQERLAKLMEKCDKYPTLTYHAIDVNGNTYTNCTTGKACAVTWGVFPGREVIQPTVVDPESFTVWKDEAFALWVKGWASIYEEGSESYDLIHDLHDQYYLVNIVDHNFVDGDIFKIFDEVIEEMK